MAAMPDDAGPRELIGVNREIPVSTVPRTSTGRSKRLTDFPGVAQAHLDVAQKLSNPLLMGPPLCDELIAFVQHLFTEEEAALVRHLGPLAGMTAGDLARAERRPLEDVEPIVRRLADVTRSIAASGPEERRSYRLLPIVPGIFEMVLIGQSPERMSHWHRRFAERFEALYETGYTRDYQKGQTRPSPVVRVLPVGRTIEAHPMALPSDRLEVVLDRYNVFGVGPCQCRMTTQVAGKGCGRPLGNCTVMGDWAARGIEQGWLTRVSRNNLLEIKREAEAHGLVTWMMNVESAPGQISCSCCGCCCHAMRMVTEFNVPGYMAPAHFVPAFDDTRCTTCGKCARSCPTGALRVDPRGKQRTYLAERCIGCGLCVVACGERRAVVMQPVPHYKLPYKSWYTFQFHSAAVMLKGAWKAWRNR
jgi:Pyruvate/2-oxoacid:ferredoxin oxidoreductase delta subunit